MTGRLAIVVPAKDPMTAKSRLKPLLSDVERRSLATTLFGRTLGFFRAEFPDLPVVVVTDSETVAREARGAGATVLRDEGVGLTAAVRQATAWVVSAGFEAQLIVPADIGALQRDEFVTLFEQPRVAPSVTIVPSADEGGTNALLSAPPDAIPLWYGEGSFARHVREAESRGIAVRIMRLPGLALDLDTPDDVHRFLAHAPHHLVPSELQRWIAATSS
jgi:2-phospho-L-lactate guanylyltransferase